MLTNYDRRKFRVRNNIAKYNKDMRPRIFVFRSNKNLYVQLVDANGWVIKSFSTHNLKNQKAISGLEKARLVGEGFSRICLQDNITKVVFDKGAYAYDGRVKILAEVCRKSGLQF